VIFIDSNVPVYLVGAMHPHKRDAQRILERCVSDQERLLTDAEVLQEILYRYAAIGRRDAIQPAFDALLGLVDEVFPVNLEAVNHARTVLLGHATLSARDAIHLAVMEHQGVSRIQTFDSRFDGFPGVTRVMA
jgi:uncharacterized protein